MTDVTLLTNAAEDASWLVERGYPTDAASEFVAIHRELDAAQRHLLARNARLNKAFRHHIAREMDPDDVRKRALAIDVASVIGTVTAAQLGRTLLESSAGVLLDPDWTRGGADSGVEKAFAPVARILDELRPASARLVTEPAGGAAIRDLAGSLGKRKWKIEVVEQDDVPGALAGSAFVVSCDPIVLDACRTWVNVVALAIEGIDVPRLRLSP